MKGFFITFEGGEGAGKTTLIQGIESALKALGRSVLKTREPGGTPLGESVRSLLLESKSSISPYAELCLFLASRAQQISDVIGPALEEGKVILCDRFNDSTIAYQGGARGLGIEKVEEMCSFVCQGLEPDLTLYLDIDPEIGLARAKKDRAQDRIEAEKITFHAKIREIYHLLHRKHHKRLHLLDAKLAPDQILKEALFLIQHKMGIHV